MEKFNNSEVPKDETSIIEKPTQEMTLEEARSAVEMLKEKYSHVKKLYKRAVTIGLSLTALIIGISEYTDSSDKDSINKGIESITWDFRRLHQLDHSIDKEDSLSEHFSEIFTNDLSDKDYGKIRQHYAVDVVPLDRSKLSKENVERIAKNDKRIEEIIFDRLEGKIKELNKMIGQE